MSDEDLTSATGEVELRAARVGMVFVLLVCAGFAVIGLCLLAGDGLVQMLGIALLVFFGAVGIPTALWRLIRPSVEVRVDPTLGVWIRELGGWTPWSDIVSVGRGQVESRPVVELHLTEGGTVRVPPTVARRPQEVFAIQSREHSRARAR